MVPPSVTYRDPDRVLPLDPQPVAASFHCTGQSFDGFTLCLPTNPKGLKEPSGGTGDTNHNLFYIRCLQYTSLSYPSFSVFKLNWGETRLPFAAKGHRLDSMR